MPKLRPRILRSWFLGFIKIYGYPNVVKISKIVSRFLRCHNIHGTILTIEKKRLKAKISIIITPGNHNDRMIFRQYSGLTFGADLTLYLFKT
jgi:hypothetical protein